MKRRTVVTLVAAATVVAAAAGLTTWWVVSRPAGAEAAATAYLQALATKDGSAAARLVGAGSDDDLAAAFRGASEYPTDPKVLAVDEHGSTGTARVSFRLDGASHTVALTLHRAGDGWRLGADALGAVQPSTTIGDAVTIGGRLATTATARRLLPAVYPVAAAPSGVLVGAASATILPGATSHVAVSASLSPDAATTAGAQLEAYEDRCTARADAVPAHCGLRVPWAADLETLDSLSFRIEKRPVLTIAADGSAFAATGGVVVATARGTTRGGSAGAFTYRATDWALRGTVSFSGGRMTLAVG